MQGLPTPQLETQCKPSQHELLQKNRFFAHGSLEQSGRTLICGRLPLRAGPQPENGAAKPGASPPDKFFKFV